MSAADSGLRISARDAYLVGRSEEGEVRWRRISIWHLGRFLQNCMPHVPNLAPDRRLMPPHLEQEEDVVDLRCTHEHSTS
jgi:hypothetical protein